MAYILCVIISHNMHGLSLVCDHITHVWIISCVIMSSNNYLSFIFTLSMIHVQGRKFENAATPTKKYNGKYTEINVTVQEEPSQICISS